MVYSNMSFYQNIECFRHSRTLRLLVLHLRIRQVFVCRQSNSFIENILESMPRALALCDGINNNPRERVGRLVPSLSVYIRVRKLDYETRRMSARFPLF